MDKKNRLLIVGLRMVCLLMLCCTTSSCAMPDTGVFHKEATKLISQTISDLGDNWDCSKLKGNLPRTVSGSTVDQTFKTYHENLGRIKTAGTPSLLNENVGIGINVPAYIGKFEVPLECEKSKAIVHITAVNQGNKWIIYEFKIKSDALPMSPEEREVTNYIDLLVPVLCRSWDIEVLKANASDSLKKEINASASSLIFASTKGLGTFIGCEGFDLVRTEVIKGEKLYELDAHPEFKNGNADLHFGAVKEAGKWQLKGFNFRANTKIH